MLPKFKFLSMTVLILIFLGSCSTTPSGEPVLLEQTPSSDPRITPTSLPVNTPRPSPTATVTPNPTLVLEERLSLAEDLYWNNAGCRLPCWWGITPGVTTWEDAKKFLEPFASVIEDNDFPENNYVHVKVQVPLELYPGDFPGWMRTEYFVKDGLIEAIQIDLPRVTTYNLPKILSEYGQPDEIYVATIIPEVYPESQFHVNLFYKNLGILATYTVESKELDESMQGCFGDRRIGLMMLWAAEKGWSYEEVKSKLVGFSMGGYPFEEATGVSVDSFYQDFKEVTSPKCLQVPKSYLEEQPY